MHTLSIYEARRGLLKKKFSSVELTKCFLDRIRRFSHLNAFITLSEEQALESAKKSDSRIALESSTGALDGIPLAIKDLFLTKGVRTTAGSKMLHNFIPPFESTVSQKLLDAGAVFLGKTNMDEFAMGSANITSHYGNVINPWSQGDKKLVPGGSSGGSAAAVAGHLCIAATGSDTGGSVRQPAAFSGIVGLKPTYGRCSRYGMVAFASSLDQAGPMTKTVRDAAIFLRVISGYDPKDSTSSAESVPDFESFVGKTVEKIKVGIPKEYYLEGMSPEIEAAWKKGMDIMRSAGAEIIEVSLPHAKYALPAYYIISPAEASANLARYDGLRYGFRAAGTKSLIEMYEKTREEGFGDEVKRRILVGTYVLSAGSYDAYYTKALQVRKLIEHDFTKSFKQVDIIMTPTTPSSAFAIGEEPQDPVSMYLNDVLTVTANMVGLPGISVPICLDKLNRPLGLQFIAPHFREDLLIQSGYILEQNANFPTLKEITI
ncbi:MAG: Asp-tRNA(Asn)/Glu-tRNA(Gln) amidotransferase subunit GatA [Holosporaceae bacterium]|jgi:aspartyl-tRNA(Asn)/glutamyl-tRNA(Gln) amidotransferase subunit A|nr:Asp-tRNA(Asn)/Glu-tRNA(Gln) amidotransferase subunit GatA [Holosporaceae bacterium]